MLSLSTYWQLAAFAFTGIGLLPLKMTKLHAGQ